MPHDLRCPDHPKYTGQNEIKRLESCSGCQAVRMAYLERLEKKRNQGKGPYPSLTSPNFNCGLVHVFAEMTVLMVYGYQPAFFWRKGANAPQHVKDLYSQTYSYIAGWLEKNPNAKTGLSRFLFQTCMAMRGKAIRDQMEHENIVQQERKEEFSWMEEESKEPMTPSIDASKVRNPFLDEGEDAEEKEEN